MRSRVRRKKFQNYLFFLGRHVHRTWESRAWSEHARSYLEPIKSQAFVSPLEARDNFKMLIGRSSFLAVTSPLHCFRRATTRASISCSLRFPELESDRCGCKTRSSDKNNRRKKKKEKKKKRMSFIYRVVIRPWSLSRLKFFQFFLFFFFFFFILSPFLDEISRDSQSSMIKIDRMVGRTSRSRIRILARTSVIGEGAIRCFVSKRFVGKIIGRGERERER